MTDLQARIDRILSMIDKLPHYKNNDLYSKLYVDKSTSEILDNAKAIIKEPQERLEMGFAYNAKGERIECKDVPDGITCRDITIRELETQLSNVNELLENQISFTKGQFADISAKDVHIASLKIEIEILNNTLEHKEKEGNFWKKECGGI